MSTDVVASPKGEAILSPYMGLRIASVALLPRNDKGAL